MTKLLTNPSSQSEAPMLPALPSLSGTNTEKYLDLLRDIELTQNQKIDIIHALFPIIWHMVDCGYTGNISEQLFLSCFQAAIPEEDLALFSSNNAPITPQTNKKRRPKP